MTRRFQPLLVRPPLRSCQPKSDGERNEALDTFVYAHAALYGLINMGSGCTDMWRGLRRCRAAPMQRAGARSGQRGSGSSRERKLSHGSPCFLRSDDFVKGAISDIFGHRSINFGISLRLSLSLIAPDTLNSSSRSNALYATAAP